MSTTSGEPPRPQRPEPLSVREGRRSLGVLHEGVPAHLERHLREWIGRFLTGRLERRVALQLEIELQAQAFSARTTLPPQKLWQHPGVDLLDVADLALQLDDELLPRQGVPARLVVSSGGRSQSQPTAADDRGALVREVTRLFDDANSVYRVARGAAGAMELQRRVDPAVQAAAEQAVASAESRAGDLLRRAWTAAYSRSPTPPSAYRDAVLAVETLACPAVLPTDQAATLGKVINHLRDAADKWELGLADDGGGRAVDDVRGMFSLLWRGEDRHGGRDYEDVTFAEARAAVHLAVTLVQWLTDGVLRPRASPSTP